MDKKTLGEVFALLPRGRTLFYYKRDEYVLMLLSWLLEAGMSLPEIRKSKWDKLLDKPVSRTLISGNNGMINTVDHTNMARSIDPVPYRLTISKWGNEKACNWNQTSRRGFNLVLQLNFPQQHNALFEKLANPADIRYFSPSAHPVSRTEHTLAWARLDFEFDTGEALIEEIQTDWLRKARTSLEYHRGYLYRAKSMAKRKGITLPSERQLIANLRTYIEQVLPVYVDGWEEIMLAATLHFIRDEMGFSKIYMHQFESGNAFKRISPKYGAPPKSLYKALPRKFCFHMKDEIPTFLLPEQKRAKRMVKKMGELGFWCMEAPMKKCVS